MNMNLKAKGVADAWGADFFGVADLAPAHEAILAQGGPVIAAYPRAVSIGIALMHSIVDQLPQREDPAVAVSYQTCCYDVVNARLDLIASHVGSLLQQEGHRAMPIPASRRVDNERLCAAFSHKLAAHLAGLGWIGKSCMLVTPEVGPRARWVTVLTDAPLQATGQPMEERCGRCRQCVEVCPAQAFTGEPFRPSEPREKRYDVKKCVDYFMGISKKEKVCGLCLYVCPHGRRKDREPAC